jgi:hypothetical protein
VNVLGAYPARWTEEGSQGVMSSGHLGLSCRENHSKRQSSLPTQGELAAKSAAVQCHSPEQVIARRLHDLLAHFTADAALQ